jgi:polyhydroxyalkanoate synthase
VPGPLHRPGPRPLLLHLMLAAMNSQRSVAASMSLNGLWPAISPALAELLGGVNPRALPQAVLTAALEKDSALLAGIAAYRRHSWVRDLVDPPETWREGDTRMLDFGGDGTPLLFVPSLVNRASVLDLTPGQSMMRHFAGAGRRTLLLDWGWPGTLERGFALADYIARLERAIASVGTPVILAGYCMGGLLALVASQSMKTQVAALALLATPWDFHAGAVGRAEAVARLLPLLEPAMQLTGTVPIDGLQTLFTLLDPFGVGDKYRRFGKLDQASARAASFVAVEDWLNDGVPLAALVAREVLGGWYGENRPARGAWLVAGAAVRPEDLRLPSFVAIPARDRIVPPESAEPLALAIPDATIIRPAAGHVGMVAGTSAARALWQPLLEWVQRLDKS